MRRVVPKISSVRSLLVLAHKGLDWTDRGAPPGVSGVSQSEGRVLRVAGYLSACYVIRYCRWAPGTVPRAPCKVLATTGAAVPPVSTSQPRCQWEAGTQARGSPPGTRRRVAPIRVDHPRGRATRRAHLRALPSAMRRKPPLILLHRAKNDQVFAWIAPPGNSQCGSWDPINDPLTSH